MPLKYIHFPMCILYAFCFWQLSSVPETRICTLLANVGGSQHRQPDSAIGNGECDAAVAGDEEHAWGIHDVEQRTGNRGAFPAVGHGMERHGKEAAYFKMNSLFSIHNIFIIQIRSLMNMY